MVSQLTEVKKLTRPRLVAANRCLQVARGKHAASRLVWKSPLGLKEFWIARHPPLPPQDWI
jgi:hypothetical protein